MAKHKIQLIQVQQAPGLWDTAGLWDPEGLWDPAGLWDAADTTP